LKAEEPDLPETNCFDDLIKELFASRVGLDGELQLRVDGRDANIHWLRHYGECARGRALTVVYTVLLVRSQENHCSNLLSRDE